MDGPRMLRLMGVTDAMTFVQKGMENKERKITKIRHKVKVRDRDKVKVRDRDNVLMSAVPGQMEADARYVPISFFP